jgi:hypothetical protein
MIKWPFAQKTHTVFCIPRNTELKLPLFQFLVIPIKDDGVVYVADPTQNLSEMVEHHMYRYLKSEQTNSFVFYEYSETKLALKNLFGKNFDKPFERSEKGNYAYFGSGNSGFCMGKATVKVREGKAPIVKLA